MERIWLARAVRMPPPAHMRLRITRQLYESIDGIQFSVFRCGYVYEVGTTIASYLLAVGAAEPVESDAPYVILPPERQFFHPRAWERGTSRAVAHDHRSIAADRAPRPRYRVSDVRERVAVLVAEIQGIKRQLATLKAAS